MNEDDEMSPAELAALFGEKAPPPEEQKVQDEYDIYRISARVNNHAVYATGNKNLTAQGRMVCNTYVHTLKAMYDFAHKMRKSKQKDKLFAIIKEQEKAPGDLIAALMSGITLK
jgi:hypothetical protein